MPKWLISALLIALAGCSGGGDAATGKTAFAISEHGRFAEPWAMAFLPDGRALITEKRGAIRLWRKSADVVAVAGAPKPDYGGQGGLGDIALHPRFAENGLVYLSWVESGANGAKGAVVGRARLVEDASAARLDGLTVIWRQQPKVSGSGHFGHRIAFGPDGLLYLSSGDRQKFDPAQDIRGNLGKVLRLSDDGRPAPGNPFESQGNASAEIWSLGHRNPLGLAFDGAGRLWELEMGPQGGDELNLVAKGANFGWPKASNGSHYGGRDIPDHTPADGFVAPKVFWNPAISPGGLMVYSGALFPAWRGDAFIAALGGEALIRVDLDGERATLGERWSTGARIREVEQGPDGAIWLLEDGDDARLLRLAPR